MTANPMHPVPANPKMGPRHGFGAARFPFPLPLLPLLFLGLIGSLGCRATVDEDQGLGTLMVSVGTAFTDTEPLQASASVDHSPTTTVTYTFDWTVDGVPAGFSTRTVPSSATTKHEVWEVTVTASDGSETSGPVKASTEILNSPPVLGPQTLSPDPGFTNSVFSVSGTVSDADGDPVTLSYLWLVGGLPNGVTTPTMDGAAAGLQNRDRVSVVVTPSDPDESGLSVTSNRLRVRNPPTTAQDTPPTSDGSTEIVVASVSTDDRRVSGSTSLLSLASPRISISESNVCRITSSGELHCSGIEEFGLTDPPPGSFTEVSALSDIACALRREDQGIQCWGTPSMDGGLLSAPGGPFTGIDLGRESACGIRLEGSIACWDGVTTPPPGTDYAQLSAGRGGCFVRTDGSLDCFAGAANSFEGVLPDGTFEQVSVGTDFGCAVTDSGSPVCFQSTLSEGNSDTALAPTEGSYVKIATGSSHACGLRTNGEIACWGDDSWGQSSPPEGRFVDLDVSDTYSCAIGADDWVSCWGLDVVPEEVPAAR